MDRTLNFDLVDMAYKDLYGENIDAFMADKIKAIFANEDLEELFYSTKKEESVNKIAALDAKNNYGREVNEKTIETFIEHFKS